MATLFDPKCLELAAHFLADIPGVTDEDRAELAVALQDAVEDFMVDLECCRACGACPGFIGAECEGDCDHAQKQEA